MTQQEPTDRAATFSRWVFFAGFVYACVLVGVGRAVDWPDWLGAVISVAGGLLCYRMVARLARRAEARARDRIAAELADALDGVHVGNLNDPVHGVYRCGKQDGYREAAGTVRHHYDEEPA